MPRGSGYCVRGMTDSQVEQRSAAASRCAVGQDYYIKHIPPLRDPKNLSTKPDPTSRRRGQLGRRASKQVVAMTKLGHDCRAEVRSPARRGAMKVYSYNRRKSQAASDPLQREMPLHRGWLNAIVAIHFHRVFACNCSSVGELSLALAGRGSWHIAVRCRVRIDGSDHDRNEDDHSDGDE
jgi:hypothetical protein